MFGSKDKKIKSSKIDTLIGDSVEFSGDIKFHGGLHLDGVINGNVSTADTAEGTVLIISERGRVEGVSAIVFALAADVVHLEVGEQRRGMTFRAVDLLVAELEEICRHLHWKYTSTLSLMDSMDEE